MMLAALLAVAFSAPNAAYVDVHRIEAAPTMRELFAGYDREIAALRATQSVPQLFDTRSTIARQETVVLSGAKKAEAMFALLPSREARHAPNETQSLEAYHAALDRETGRALASYRAGLNARVQSALGARQQELGEKEADLELNLARAAVGRTLPLSLKLAVLKSPQVDRAQLRREYNSAMGRENSAVATLHARNQSELETYRAALVASAQRDYATMEAKLRARASANWQHRQGLTTAVPMVVDSNASSTAFASAALDIAGRFAVVQTLDAQARGNAANEIIALQRNRAALRQEIDREARSIAQRLARERSLRLIEARAPGTVDLTQAVEREMEVLH